jgi:glycosyltransferase involved in cell wall biosynthesis
MHAKCEALVVPSAVVAKIVSQHINRRPEVISNGVDLSCFHPRPVFPGEREALAQAYGLALHLPVILCVGRIDADKRVDVVVHAAAQAMRVTDAQLLVVGDGLRRAAMLQLCEELGIWERAHFPGFVSVDGDLPGLFRLASVFVTASEIEVQSSTALEAAATGKPIVTVRASSMSEIVQEGLTGYLVPPGDVDAMAQRLVYLLRDPRRAQAMGLAGRALAQKHSLAATIDAHEALYRSLCA